MPPTKSLTKSSSLCARVENNFSRSYPDIAKEWHPTKNTFTPTEVTPKSGKRVWWLCDVSHEWQAPVYSRSNGYGCPYCSGRYATAENNLQVRARVLHHIKYLY